MLFMDVRENQLNPCIGYARDTRDSRTLGVTTDIGDRYTLICWMLSIVRKGDIQSF
jgi:hypothetical protein